MSYTTLTRYLKLKIDSDLSADAVYNLQRIDAIASTFVIDSTDKLKIQSKQNIEIEPNDSALGGTGIGGRVEIGTTLHSDVEFRAFVSSFQIDSGLETKNQASGKTNYLKLVFDSENTDARTLTLDLGAANRSIAFDHTGKKTAVVKDDNGDFSAGTITATLDGNASNITASSNSTLTTLSSLSLPGSQVSGNINGNAANVTGTVAIANGGTGATTAPAAAAALLPSYTSNANKVLGLNVDGNALEWKTAGSGIVQTISVGPVGTALSVDNAIPSLPVISLPAADTDTDGYLTSTNWNTFNNKEPAIAEGTLGQYWRGNKTWVDLTKSSVGLSNVDNTSDVNKPVSLATATALSVKQNTIPVGTSTQYYRGDKTWATLDTDAVTEGTAKYFTDARAKTAAVVNSTAGSETDQAASVSAMKSYVAANSGPKYSTTWAVADGNSKTVTHPLGTREVLVTIYDESYETVYVDSEVRTDTDTVTLTRVGTATGTWTVIIKKL